ncbi:MAG: PepSY domain-containing protein, partial [Sphingobium sp.]
MSGLRDASLYRALWRWHFYAGLMVMPLVLILSITGAIYLFKPQVERWEERAWQDLPTSGAASPNVQAEAALAAFPGARFHSYRLPERPGDAALIHLGLADGRAMRDVFVSPQGKVVGSLDPETRIEQVVHDIHGQLLIGRTGSWIVELAASWAIVMILTGLYLWWPRGRGLAGVVWPRLGRRTFWRDIHAVTGFWVAG